MIELLPCPFCGGKAEIKSSISHPLLNIATCQKCLASSSYDHTPDLVAKLWNTRHCDGWVSVIDFLPPFYDREVAVLYVLPNDETLYSRLANWDGQKWRDEWGNDLPVAYWFPIPEEPDPESGEANDS